MIHFRAFGTYFTLPWLTLCMPFLAVKLGMNGSMGTVLFSLGIHELAHIAAARILGVEITEIRLMPFGGSARMENPYKLSAGKIIPVAAAGPTANLLTAVACAALAHWSLLSISAATAVIQPSLVLCLFNLLPALPLDGGRILFATLRNGLGEQKALKICIRLGWLLAGLLITAAVHGGMRSGRWNLTLILAAIFIIVSGRDEQQALSSTRAAKLEAQMHAPSKPQLARIYQLDAHTTACEALKLLRSRERTWFVLSENNHPSRLLDGSSIVTHIINGGAPETALRDLPTGFPLHAASGAPKAKIFN